MSCKIQILMTMMAIVSGSFFQAQSNHFQSTFNPTFLSGNQRLFKPIIILNDTKNSESLQALKVAETSKTEDLQQPHHPQEHPWESTLTDSNPDEEPVSENSHKFSSRYSIKQEHQSDDGGRAQEAIDSSEELSLGTTKIPGSSRRVEGETEIIDLQETEKSKLFFDRSDDFNGNEEEKDVVRKYSDTSEMEESEINPTTNEPYRDLPRPTSFRSNVYPSEDLDNYETTSILAEENEYSKEEDSEEKRSIDDYYNSGSKNYHSVQTPLNKIKYKGPHSVVEDFDSERVRTMLVSPIERHFVSRNRPYSKALKKTDFEESNEISESEESEENSLELGIREELKGKPKLLELELAVEKDKAKFNQNRKNNFIEERKLGEQKVKSLAAEEDKDHRRSPLKILQQYQVDEQPRYQPSWKTPQNLRTHDKVWSRRHPLITTPRNIFKEKTEPSVFNISDELTPNFQADQFLGPVVFNHNSDHEKSRAVTKTQVKTVKGPAQKVLAAGLLEKEKLDQDHMTDQRGQKSIFKTKSRDVASQSFNHLEESDEMYNAILANIQSVFGLRTQSLKSDASGNQSSGSRVGYEESKALTWSVPLVKRTKVD